MRYCIAFRLPDSTCSGSEFAHVCRVAPSRAYLAVLVICLALPGTVSAGFVSVIGCGEYPRSLDDADRRHPRTSSTTPAPTSSSTAGTRSRMSTLTRDVFVDVFNPAVYNHNNDLGYLQPARDRSPARS